MSCDPGADHLDRETAQLTHSAAFMERWRDMLVRTCGFSVHDGYVVMRDVLGHRVVSYLPLLNYTDKTSEVLAGELRELGVPCYIGRALNPQVREFSVNDPVTMRLPLSPAAEPDLLWKERFDAKLRNQIRKAQKGGLDLQVSQATTQAEDFYGLYRRRMHELGSPSLDYEVFEQLPGFVDTSFYVVYLDNRPVAGLVMVYDGPLAWVPWAASDRRYIRYCPNHLMYWQAIQDAQRAGSLVFDFGRSPYSGETYRFKYQWGARPVKVDILKPHSDDPYTKYALAAAVWKRLPAMLVDRLGPVLCRHLPDL